MKMMKKSTKVHRKCPNCPHSNPQQQKCCCQRPSSSYNRSKALTSRPKKDLSTIDNSSMVNTTIPTMMAQFSALRTQNNHLKRELLNVSAFLKDEPQCNPTAFIEPSLNEKLFIANKNLKESLLQIDNLAKINKELYERNSQLSEQCEGLKIQTRQIESYLDRYKKKCKKYSKAFDELPNRDQIDRLIKQNVDLEQENKTLKEELRCLKFENKNFSMIGTLSPEWVAHTHNKIGKAAGQHMIKVEDIHDEHKEDEMQFFKRSLSETINLLKNEGSHFTSTSFDNIGSVELVGMEQLMQSLIETYSQTIFGHFSLLAKEINRKLNTYEKKMANLTSKLQNFLLIFHNKKAKKRIYPHLSFMKTERLPMADLTNRV